MTQRIDTFLFIVQVTKGETHVPIALTEMDE